MPKYIRCPAIVIGGQDLGESDRLITFYSLNKGKVRGVAKGAKRSKHRFVNALEPFTSLILTLVPPKTSSLSRIDSVEIDKSFPEIRKAYTSYVMACLCVELVDLWTKEHDANESIFHLLYWYLNVLNKGFPPQRTTLVFKIHLLSLVGYRPRLDFCVSCHSPLTGKQVSLHISEGGFVCQKCQPVDENRVSLGTLNTVKFISKTGLNRVHRIIIPEPTLKEAWFMIRNFHRHYLQRMPSSYKVIEESRTL